MRARAVGQQRPPSTHPLSPPEMVVEAGPEGERLWVPQASNAWFRPLMLNRLNGGWCRRPHTEVGHGAGSVDRLIR